MEIGLAFSIGIVIGLIVGAIAIGFFLERRRARDREQAAAALAQDKELAVAALAQDRERAADAFKSMALEQLDSTKSNLIKATNEKLDEFTKPLDKLKETTDKLEGAYRESSSRVENLGEKSDPDLLETLVVWDELGSGQGQLIALSEGGEAAQPFRPELKPVDSYNAAILDTIDVKP